MPKEVTLENLADKIDKGFDKINESIDSIHTDLVKHDSKFEELTEALNKKPDREEFPQLLGKIFEYTALKIEHDHMKKVIREKLGVEI